MSIRGFSSNSENLKVKMLFYKMSLYIYRPIYNYRTYSIYIYIYIYILGTWYSLARTRNLVLQLLYCCTSLKCDHNREIPSTVGPYKKYHGTIHIYHVYGILVSSLVYIYIQLDTTYRCVV
jgi:hypothetical protein